MTSTLTPLHDDATRRQFLGILAAAGLLAACGDESDPAASGDKAADDGPWSFTDDLGNTIELDKRPARIVAWQTIVPALTQLGVDPVGVIAFYPPAEIPAFQDAGVDVDSLTAVSTEYGEVNLEKLAALRPDVIITYTFGDDLLTGFTDEKTQQQVAKIAPIIALDATVDVEEGIARQEELAEALGADLSSEQATAAADDYAAAKKEMAAAAEANPDVTVAFVGPYEEGIYLAAVNEEYPELRAYSRADYARAIRALLPDLGSARPA